MQLHQDVNDPINFVYVLTPFLVHMLQGEPCSVCPTLGELPAHLRGTVTQTLQQKGEKGEPGVGQKGEQVSLL